jgi:hypothetical protein
MNETHPETRQNDQQNQNPLMTINSADKQRNDNNKQDKQRDKTTRTTQQGSLPLPSVISSSSSLWEN